jgi:hypothetical protein
MLGGDNDAGTVFALSISSPPELPDADFDNDNDVDDMDLSTWESGYAAGTLHSEGDADGDNDVDGEDFLIWQEQYTGPLLVAASEAVPEPATGGMLVLVLAVLLLRRDVALP